ncbi:MAG: hypothetical protein HYT12_03670 [Candidatus Liptonbacteria bacterium]|nr:hypothetical protein [Candidatus Liptonbacteria bacterium]
MENAGENKEKISELAHRWETRLQEKLDEALSDPSVDKKKIEDTLWEYGILERIDPRDSEEREARKENSSDLWDGGRDNPELYWRLLYSLGLIHESIKRNYSLVGGLAVGALTGIVYLHAKAQERIYKEFFPGSKNAYVDLNNDLIEKAKDELHKRGVANPQLISWGSEGVWKGIPVTVERYASDGTVVFHANNISDHMKIYDLSDRGSVLPSSVNPEDFTLPLKRPKQKK